MLGMILMLVFFILIQSGLYYLFAMLGVSAIAASIGVDFILSLILTLFRFRGNLKGFYKNKLFLQTFAIYLLIFGLFTFFDFFLF